MWRREEKDFEKRVKRAESVEKEAVKTDGRADGYHGQKLCSPYHNDGQNEVNHIKKGLAD